MADEHAGYESLDEGNGAPPIARRRLEQSADLDITPMIDVTFLLLIFFLVSSTTERSTTVELPPARYGKGVSDRNSVVLTISGSGESGPARVYLDDGITGTPLPDDHDTQDARITQYVQEGFNEGKPNVLVKADKEALHREVSRVVAAAGRVEGVHMHLAVFEIE